MSNYKTTIEQKTTELRGNNTDLQGLFDTINALPDAENLDEVLDEQDSIIDQIQAALEGKSAAAPQTATINFSENDPGGLYWYDANGVRNYTDANAAVVIPIPQTILLYNGCTAGWGVSGDVDAHLISGSGAGSGYVACYVYGDCSIYSGGIS